MGLFVLVLNGHIPYCKKSGVWPFGEEWVFEAMADTYIPVLDIVTGLAERGIAANLTISMSPVLLEQLKDQYMVSRFEEYLREKASVAEAEAIRHRDNRDEALAHLAEDYGRQYRHVLESFTSKYKRDIVAAFRAAHDAGLIEMTAGVATHAYLPLLLMDASVNAQIGLGREVYRVSFGREPAGIWLPECGYRPALDSGGNARPGLEFFLERHGFGHFFVDSHAVESGIPAGRREGGVPGAGTAFLPYRVKDSSVCVLARNKRVALQVWSEEWGYPGDGDYREFHKRDSVSGFHYWRVTHKLSGLEGKDIYRPDIALGKAALHASHFVGLVEGILSEFEKESGREGVVVAPYDAELFGHWWFEGTAWLKMVLERMSQSQIVRAVTAREAIARYEDPQEILLPESSWGTGGRHYAWANPGTQWIWDLIHACEAKVHEVVGSESGLEARGKQQAAGKGPGLRDRALRQFLREALLMQGSDWPFLVATGQASDYAISRFSEHQARFDRLYSALRAEMDVNGGPAFDSAFESYLSELEDRDSAFRELEPHIWQI